MKSAFSYNLLKHLRAKKAEGGFTLIELLVVIIIIGILAAIALPSFLNQANRARETEATNSVGSLNRGQQAFYLEAVEFATVFDDLDVGVSENTENYGYGTVATEQTDAGVGDGTFNVDDTANPQVAVVNATPKEGLRGFVGVSYIDTVTSTAGNDKSITKAVLCREQGGDIATGGIQNPRDTSQPAAEASTENVCGANLDAVN